jgi:hypothetical protein
MSLIRVDHFVPQYVPQTTLTNGTTFVAKPLLLNGVATVTIQFNLSGGAAGTCYAEATNYDTQDPAAKWVPCQSFMLAANTTGAMVFSAVDQLTGMHAMRIRIVPTASGSVVVAVNLRHLSH